MKRRTLLAASAAAAGLPRAPIAQTARDRVLRFVPLADLSALDPIAASSNPTRNHAYMVYDTLYGADAALRPHPQMAEGHVWEEDGRLLTITLRDGLLFHDGERVRAADATASLRRWMVRSTAFGDKLRDAILSLDAVDDRRLRFRLRRPFPFLIDALASPVGPVAFIMPERMAATDPFRPVTEHVGSGPFRFLAGEYQQGSHAAYARFERYVPSGGGGTGLTAGAKVAHFDRVEWRTMDYATAGVALQAGEIDWFEQVPPELQAHLARRREIAVDTMDLNPLVATFRPNRMQPPFNDKRLLQALLPAVNQADFMQAVVGTDPSRFVADAGVFTPGSPYASDVGLEPLRGPRDLAKARRMLREAGYDGQPIRLMGPTDILAPAVMTQVAADMLRRLEVNLDLALTDWGGVVQRRNSRAPVEQGGWSCTCFANSSMDFWSPATHISLRGNGAAGYFGWPDVPALETLRDEWFEAPNLPEQQRIAREIQRVAMDELPVIPLGGYHSVTAHRRTLRDRVKGFAIFWGLRRA